MRMTTIRSTLISLVGCLGALVLLLSAFQLYDLHNQRQQARNALASNELRNQLVEAAMALGRERDARYLALALDRPMPPEAQTTTDRSLAGVEGTGKGGLQDIGPMTELTARVVSFRQTVDAAMGLAAGSARRQYAARYWFEGASAVVADLLSLRIKLLSQMDSDDPKLFGFYFLRTETLSFLNELSENAALLEVDIAQASIAGALSGSKPSNFARTLVPDISLSSSQFDETLGFIGPANNLTLFDTSAYIAAEVRLRAALENGQGIEPAVADWRQISDVTLENLTDLQTSISEVIKNAAVDEKTRANAMLIFWAAIFLSSAALIAITTRIVTHSVVGPLEQMRDAMLQLADDNFAIDLPQNGKLAEINAMDDALRVFKANGIRRQNLQKERLRLHGRLEETYSHLKTDLEAAAAIQASLLPQQSQLGGVSLSSYFRPSNILAGDTFDVLQQPNGRVIVFQIDVAGHGAAAALVSVASKYSVAQAILQRQPDTDLAALTEQINREWPGDLPYFTLLLAEVDPAAGKGSLVQAGHPSPLLMRASGEFEVLGDGGLPIGVLTSATYDLIHFEFGPDDRLIVMTDGVHEMADRNGEPFSEERVHDLIRASGKRSTEDLLTDLDITLRAWRGDDTLDDDVTIVILEGKRNHERS